ncbi:MAG TPA: hypothetical protein VMH48_10680 [Methylomirabilota bacterium]|nr:hypothetical protein [Methylomirabilota bacterium]
MSSAVVRISAGLLVVCLFSIPSKTQNEKPPAEQVWFAVEERPRGQLRIEPFAIAGDGKLNRFPSPCMEEYSENSEQQEVAARYLQTGQTYSVVFGGAAAGQVRVVAAQPRSRIAEVAYEGPIKIRGKVKALATNETPTSFRVESRQTATKEERAAALELAREIFREHGIARELLSKVRTDFLTRTVLAPSPMSSWIGTFTLETGGEQDLQHNLFLIATQGVGKLEAEMVWIRVSERMDEDETAEFVDHADLLGDGHDEVVARLTSTENHRYAVYRRSIDGAHWEQIFMTHLMECD